MIYTFESRVRYSEIDEHAQMTVVSLVKYLQDCCIFHGEDVGVGVQYNMERGNAWIVADLQMQIYEYPKFGDRIRVRTWAPGFRGMIGQRDFRVEREDGTMLAEAASEWVFWDFNKTRPVRIPDDQYAYGIEPDEKPTRDLGHRKIRTKAEMREEESFRIQEYHLDTNKHVNNAEYLRLAARYLPADFEIHHLRLEFKKQAVLGDVIVPTVSDLQEGNAYYVKLTDPDGDSYFTAEFIS